MAVHSPSRFEGVQALRFVAALLVVLTHATFYASERLVPGLPIWASGAAGVDVFFVISGFVMLVSSHALPGGAESARAFAIRRLTRIVPLYWLATTLKLLAVLAVPGALLHSQIDVGHIVRSYLFLPSMNEAGELKPVLGVGWTLNFEMFFYALFGLALLLRRSPIRFVTGVLVGLSALALLRTPDWPAIAFWADTVVLEFVAGMAIAHWTLAGRRLPTPVALGVLAIGLVGLLWPWGAVPDMLRVVTWGVPAALIVAAVASLEPVLQGRVPRSALLLGDSSYALYLFHPMVAPIVPVVLAKLGLIDVTLSIALSVAASITAGLVVHRFFERPVTRALKPPAGSSAPLRTA